MLTKRFLRFVCRTAIKIEVGLKADVYFCKHISRVPENSVVFFPIQENRLSCGLTGIVSFKTKKESKNPIDLTFFDGKIQQIESRRFTCCKEGNLTVADDYLGGNECLDSLYEAAQSLKEDNRFYKILTNSAIFEHLSNASKKSPPPTPHRCS